jgi:hypothetical protein
MHDCINCGCACYCHGDIDDCVVETWQYSAAHCTGCGCGEDPDAFEDDEYGDGEQAAPVYPRYFTRTGGFSSDALYVRYDAEGSDGVVVTATGERQSHHGPWPIIRCQLMVASAQGRELSADEARAIAPHGVTAGPGETFRASDADGSDHG